MTPFLPECRDMILKELADIRKKRGISLIVQARELGVARMTLYRWRERNMEPRYKKHFYEYIAQWNPTPENIAHAESYKNLEK